MGIKSKVRSIWMCPKMGDGPRTFNEEDGVKPLILW